jgi:hypothetical protein
MANPTMCHWTADKHILRYLKGTKNIGITYSKPESDSVTSQNNFTGYSDASFANNYDHTSVSGYAFISAGGMITWGSKKQNIISLSTTKAEYVFWMWHVKPHGYAIYMPRLDIHKQNQLWYMEIIWAH